jgi:hypothetical protein
LRFSLAPGKTYPLTLYDVSDRFAADAACAAYLARLRWDRRPDAFECRYCGPARL